MRRLSAIGAAAIALILSSCAAELTGTVRMIGNEPNATLVLSLDDGRTLAIRGPLAAELAALQYRRVTLRGSLADEAGLPGQPPPFEVTAIVRVFEDAAPLP